MAEARTGTPDSQRSLRVGKPTMALSLGEAMPLCSCVLGAGDARRFGGCQLQLTRFFSSAASGGRLCSI